MAELAALLTAGAVARTANSSQFNVEHDVSQVEVLTAYNRELMLSLASTFDDRVRSWQVEENPEVKMTPRKQLCMQTSGQKDTMCQSSSIRY